MASADPRDPMYGLPYVGSPSRQVDPRGGSQTVLDMYRMVNVRITTSTSDSHYTPNGDLYHE